MREDCGFSGVGCGGGLGRSGINVSDLCQLSCGDFAGFWRKPLRDKLIALYAKPGNLALSEQQAGFCRVQ